MYIQRDSIVMAKINGKSIKARIIDMDSDKSCANALWVAEYDNPDVGYFISYNNVIKVIKA